MSAYADDPRVTDDDGWFVVIGDDRYLVHEDDSGWIRRPAPDSNAERSVKAGWSSSHEAVAWRDAHTIGPCGTADEAIRALIGDPQ